MQHRFILPSILGFTLTLSLASAESLAPAFASTESAAPGDGGSDGSDGSELRRWCKGGTIHPIHDTCGNHIGDQCLGGRDSGQTRQYSPACD